MDKPLARLTKLRRDESQIKSEIKKGDITTDVTEIKIIREYCKQLATNGLDNNPEAMDTFRHIKAIKTESEELKNLSQ
jgi:hypothetical protein